MRRTGVAILLILVSVCASAQYFGRNKIQYHDYDFKILRTSHFDVYYYRQEAATAQQAGRMAERWYARLSQTFQWQLSGRQPVILYANSRTFAPPQEVALKMAFPRSADRPALGLTGLLLAPKSDYQLLGDNPFYALSGAG
jgi:hypothetical protein